MKKLMLWENRNRRIRADLRPALKDYPDLDGYETIYLGCPIGYYDLPMPLYTFLENTDLSGRTIVPFAASAPTGFGSALETIEALQPEAVIIKDGFSIRHADAEKIDQKDIHQWPGTLNLNH